MSELGWMALEVAPEKDYVPNSFTGRYVHAVMLKLLQTEYPDLTEAIHASRTSPLRVSPLIMSIGNDRYREATEMHAGRHLYALIRSLDERTTSAIEGLEGFSHRRERISECEVMISDVSGEHENRGFPLSNLPNSKSYEEIYNLSLEEAEAWSGRFSVFFATPAFFRREGKNMLFPSPALLMNGLKTSWNEFSDIHFGEDFHEVAERQIMVTSYNLRTTIKHIDNFKQVGFLGKCSYKVSDKAEFIIKAIVLTLLSYSRFSGVGAKTPMGFGMVNASAF